MFIKSKSILLKNKHPCLMMG